MGFSVVVFALIFPQVSVTESILIQDILMPTSLVLLVTSGLARFFPAKTPIEEGYILLDGGAAGHSPAGSTSNLFKKTPSVIPAATHQTPSTSQKPETGYSPGFQFGQKQNCQPTSQPPTTSASHSPPTEPEL
jgi:hypothetical protein